MHTKITVSSRLSAIGLTLFAVFCFCLPLSMEPIFKEEDAWLDIKIGFALMGLLSGSVFICMAFSEFKCYTLTENGISISMFAFTYREILWKDIYDVMVAHDPYAKYENHTILLNCQKDRVYRPRKYGSDNSYEKAFYKDLRQGKIIRIRSGKKQQREQILALIAQNYSGEIWKERE